jgi:hypothetical protein
MVRKIFRALGWAYMMCFCLSATYELFRPGNAEPTYYVGVAMLVTTVILAIRGPRWVVAPPPGPPTAEQIAARERRAAHRADLADWGRWCIMWDDDP